MLRSRVGSPQPSATDGYSGPELSELGHLSVHSSEVDARFFPEGLVFSAQAADFFPGHFSQGPVVAFAATYTRRSRLEKLGMPNSVTGSRLLASSRCDDGARFGVAWAEEHESY